METETWTPRELPIIAGHLALDFANTVDDPEGPERWDHIASAEALMYWARRIGLVPDEGDSGIEASAQRDSSVGMGDGGLLSSAHLLREALNDLFGPLADTEPVPDEAWGRLQPFVAEAIRTAALLPAGPAHSAYRYNWAHLGGVRGVIHSVAAAAGDLLVSEDLSRLKRCGRCPWLFLDDSKNLSRRWCDMNDCGKAEKIERYLAKRAARRRDNTSN